MQAFIANLTNTEWTLLGLYINEFDPDANINHLVRLGDFEALGEVILEAKRRQILNDMDDDPISAAQGILEAQRLSSGLSYGEYNDDGEITLYWITPNMTRRFRRMWRWLTRGWYSSLMKLNMVTSLIVHFWLLGHIWKLGHLRKLSHLWKLTHLWRSWR